MRDPAHNYHHLVLLPITSQRPSTDRIAIEIPETELRRAGLTRYPRAWVLADEYNYDIAERSWYFDPEATLGKFSATFVRAIAKELRGALLNVAARVDRTR
jgi:hypothetical protein